MTGEFRADGMTGEFKAGGMTEKCKAGGPAGKISRGKDPYASIRDLPHHVSAKHPQMSMRDRAAQFSPFAALSGYEGAIETAAREAEEAVLSEIEHVEDCDI